MFVTGEVTMTLSVDSKIDRTKLKRFVQQRQLLLFSAPI